MPYPVFERGRLIIKPLAERTHDLDLSVVLPLDGFLRGMAAQQRGSFGRGDLLGYKKRKTLGALWREPVRFG